MEIMNAQELKKRFLEEAAEKAPQARYLIVAVQLPT
jgi:hypothetical protein